MKDIKEMIESAFNSDTKRCVTIHIPTSNDDLQYRVTCKFGYNSFINNNWWLHLQVGKRSKKYIFFGSMVTRWSEVTRCWMIDDYTTREELSQACIEYYNRMVKAPSDRISNAMNL